MEWTTWQHLTPPPHSQCLFENKNVAFRLKPFINFFCGQKNHPGHGLGDRVEGYSPGCKSCVSPLCGSNACCATVKISVFKAHPFFIFLYSSNSLSPSLLTTKLLQTCKLLSENECTWQWYWPVKACDYLFEDMNMCVILLKHSFKLRYRTYRIFQKELII